MKKHSAKTAKKILEKYASTIKDEVNVKNIELLDESVSVTKTYLPIGSALSEQFGKETGQIIKAAKTGSAHETENGHLVVKEGDKSRELTPDQFSVRYSGIDESHQTVEGGAIIDLDLTITPGLKAEGIAREISRFLNQMRKDADYTVDQRISCFFSSNDTQLIDIIQSHKDFLMREALLDAINAHDSSSDSQKGDITQTFECDQGTATFSLQQ